MIALIDADMLIFTLCAAAETEVEWDHDFWTLDTDLKEAKAHFAHWYAEIAPKYDSLVFCLSDSQNFRKSVYPEYKWRRSKYKEFARNGKPLGYRAMCEWLRDRYVVKSYPGLEGDDAIGILMTGDTVCLSGDKDMKTVPGYHAPLFGFETPVLVDNAEADLAFYAQALGGDQTDGYPGCPGYGEGKATEALKAMTVIEPYDHILKGGKRKGEIVVRWKEVPTDDPWQVVVSRYRSKGLTEDFALSQARCARILRPGEYDFDSHNPRLWKP